MKRTIQSIFALGILLLLAGCSANKNRIELVSDAYATQDKAESPATTPAAHQKLADEDLFKVQVAIYGYLLQRHFLEAGEYSAVFVQGDDAEVDALIKQFPNHVPPIKPGDQADLRPNRTPLDRQTGKPAIIFSVDAMDPVGGTVEAIGRWYAGSAVAGFYTFSLRKVDGDWVIESAK